MQATPEDLTHLLRLIRRSHEGLLWFDEVFEPSRYVCDPADGAPVMPVPAHALESEEVTFHIPDDSADAVHLLGRMVEIDPAREGACDRWLACFGKPGQARWGKLDIECAKRADFVVDGERALLANPLRSAEGALCRRFNAEPAALARVCRHFAGTDVADPTLVGVDPFGIDVRARFGVVRVEFPALCATAEEAAAAIADLAARS